MSLSPELAALRDEAMSISCIGWAAQKNWKLSPGIDRAGPCPKCGGKDRFSIHSKENIFNCRQCGIAGSGVIDLVMKTEDVSFVRACEIITGRAVSDPVDERRMDELRRAADEAERRRTASAAAYRERAREDGHKLWIEGLPVVGADMAEDMTMRYLAQRALDLADVDPGQLGALRSHLDLPWMEEFRDEERGTHGWRCLHSGPAMLAKIVLPARLIVPGDRFGQFGGVHMTWIDLAQPKGKLVLPPDESGKPRPSKKVRGRKKGGAIPLFTPKGARRIVMGEGIETTLTPLCHAFEPETAYWAGVDLGNMGGKALRVDGTTLHDQPDMTDIECFLPPDWCEELVYLGEGDDASVHSREKCHRGLSRAAQLRAGRPELPLLRVIYVPPPDDGGDLNDVAMREQAAAMGESGEAGVTPVAIDNGGPGAA